MGVKSGGGDGVDASSAVKKLGGDVSYRFKNEVAQIRCLFRILGYFGGKLATIPTIRPPHSKIRDDAPVNNVC